MGAATLAQAIAGGLRDKHKELTHVVLLAIGLFYEPAADGRMRGQDYALERTWMQRNVTAIDPRPGNNWPEEIQTFYENWPPTSRPHQQPRSDMEELCNRVSFMFGQPYRELNLPPEMHEHPFLAEQFGSIPLRMYVHCAQNVRRGWAAKFDAKNDNDELISRAAQERFADLAKVTLITGAKNTIWHRDSIDRMYEWLRRTPRGRANSRREILREYAHQDLLWGKDAYKDVFPMIRDGLPPQEKSDS
jgi:cholesterol oxidase